MEVPGVVKVDARNLKAPIVFLKDHAVQCHDIVFAIHSSTFGTMSSISTSSNIRRVDQKIQPKFRLKLQSRECDGKGPCNISGSYNHMQYQKYNWRPLYQ